MTHITMSLTRLPMLLALIAAVGMAFTTNAKADDSTPGVVFVGGDGPGAGKHIVLIAGDEEYRSEETMPQLAKILSQHHGFRCTVLFSVNPETGEIDPMNQNNIPGLEVLADADLMIIFTRYRDLPDEQMVHIADYVNSGRPIIGLRTATHAFRIDEGKTYSHWSNLNEESHWEGGFGRQVLGERWVRHHGRHGSESTRGLVAEGMEDHPIMQGISDGDAWGPTDVYAIRLPLPETCQPVMMGQVLEGMSPDDAPLETRKNNPMMPIGWTNHFTSESGVVARVFCTTMGASQDFSSFGLRRMLVNASYWCLELEDQIPAESCVDIVGEYNPNPYRSGRHTRGVMPSDHALPE